MLIRVVTGLQYQTLILTAVVSDTDTCIHRTVVSDTDTCVHRFAMYDADNCVPWYEKLIYIFTCVGCEVCGG